MKKELKSGVFAAVLLSAASGQVHALDCNGTSTCAFGGTSNGAFDISFTKGDHARIWGLADLAMTDAATASTPVTQDICVYSNKDGTSSTYELAIVSSSGFELADTTGSGSTSVPYHIKVTDSGSGSVDSGSVTGGSVSVTGNLEAGPLASQPDPTNPCNSNKNAHIAVWFDTAPTNVTSGVYHDTVTLTVSPQ